ncbi:MAG: alanine racemase [Thiomicrorhabdus sp.]|nr:MAG: alanine racemase [Thiomicrorhabdus sp.]
MFYRPAKAYINLPALRANLAYAKKLAPKSKVLAVIKANGYGHGISRVAQQLAGADGFGVASIDEALYLRQKGFLHRVLLLEGLFSESEIPLVIQNRLDLVVHSYHQVDWLLSYQTDVVINVWIKIDTGMHRLGFDLDQVAFVIKQLEDNLNHFNIHLMSHLASADETEQGGLEFTQMQLARFEQATQSSRFPKSLVNSAGLLHYGSYCFDWVRPGIMLFGAGQHNNVQLQTVMRLESEVISLKWIEEGGYVGYGHSWQAAKETFIAVVAIGYGDGYPRHAKVGTPVLINGQRCPLIGLVSMDMITIDITELANKVSIGDIATLWGKDLPVDEIAEWADTISYELLCGITKRVPMIEVQ